MAHVIDSLLSCREKKTMPNYKTLIPQLIDTTALFGHVCKELSYKRRDAIRPILHPDYKPLCSHAHKALLFGDDLAKKAQDMKTSSQTVAHLLQSGKPNVPFKRPPPGKQQGNKPFLSQRGRPPSS